ncbi:MAG TPA: metallophosphoesterase [Thermoanaerobaculia bacterium]|nr:metallophosphoesterase [Thermoanaerobaculia bacterium]
MNNRRNGPLLLLLCAGLAACATPARAGDGQAKGRASPASSWKFVVGGDSRNCGDVVMPAVAAGAISSGAALYWHLGDFRALHDFDEDLLQARRVAGEKPMTIIDYNRGAWDDFLQSQLLPFGSIPVFLTIGNHELVAPKSRLEFLAQFADWFNAPPIQAQRLKDNPKDHRMKSYYHWIQNGVDFLSLDNASNDQFDDGQLAWFEGVLNRSISDPSIAAIVVGMHAALPDSLASDHSMSDWAQGEYSGRRVYKGLLKAQAAGKKVYALASHSHFYMSGIFDSFYWQTNGGVIPGWIIGTTGAIRYALPHAATKAKEARTNTYGYLVATVNPGGAIGFDFQEIKESDVPAEVAARFTPAFVHQCFVGNIFEGNIGKN